MRRVTGLILILGSVSLASEVHIGIKNFNWTEHEGGKQLLEESGNILSFGGRWEREVWFLGGEVYGGTVRYDGQTQSGCSVQTNTKYLGTVILGGIKGNFTKFLRGEIGYRGEFWIRSLEDTFSQKCGYVIGYDEYWAVQSLDLTLIATGRLTSNKYLYVFGTYHYTISARMKPNIVGFPVLKPKRGPAFDVGIGGRWNNIGLELSYSYTKFEKSDPQPIDSIGIAWQPESVRRETILRLLWYF